MDHYLQKYNPVQLRDSSREIINMNYQSINFGESKGLTFDRVLIYPTKPFINWMNDNNSELAPMSRSKFYVALTRAKFSVGIVYDFNDGVHIDGVQKYVK
ncbi:hypothetical protein D3C76_1177760 [compost metagenome]